jgi:hypothetical protein
LNFLLFEVKIILKNKFRTPFTYKYCLRSKKSKIFKTIHLFYVSYFKFLYNYFFKFVIHEINSKIIKSKIMVLTKRENVDVTDIDVTLS